MPKKTEIRDQESEVTPMPVALAESKSPPPVAISLDFQSLAAHMNYRMTIIKDPSKAAGRAVVEIGFLILLAKRALPHGEMNKWVNDNTNVNSTWAAYCRRAAEKFCTTHGEEPLLMLCNPSADNPPEEVQKAEQLLMEFTGGKGPAAMLHDLGIKKRDAQTAATLPPGETAEHYDAIHTWRELGESISTWGLDRETWAYLNQPERETIYEVVNELARRIRKSLKG